MPFCCGSNNSGIVDIKTKSLGELNIFIIRELELQNLNFTLQLNYYFFPSRILPNKGVGKKSLKIYLYNVYVSI